MQHAQKLMSYTYITKILTPMDMNKKLADNLKGVPLEEVKGISIGAQ